jgi:subtilisin family serine protease
MLRWYASWVALSLFALLAASAPAAPPRRGTPIKISATTGLKAAPGIAEALAASRTASGPEGADDPDHAFVIDAPASGAAAQDKQYAVVNLEFKDAQSCANLKVDNVHPFARTGRFADVFALNTDATFAAISKAEGIVWHELFDTVKVPPPAVPLIKKESPRDIPEQIVRGGLGGLTGKGVIVAVIDSGLDFRHPDFITYDDQGRPTSRLLYFWDTSSDLWANGVGSPAPIKFPSGSPAGTVYSRELLTQELRSARPQIAMTDPNGHGTSCAGVAAGNGNVNKEYAGVAPQADLIGFKADQDGDRNLDSACLVSGFCAWLDEVAGARPLVVSCSWGGQQAGRDGQLIIERHLDARFPLDRRGRACCFAAGNEGDIPVHASLTLGSASEPSHLFWQADRQATMTIYFQTKGDVEIELGGLDETPINAAAVKSFIHPLTNQMIVELPVPAGSGGLYLGSDAGAGTITDAYIRGAGAKFTDKSYELSKGISTPSAAAGVLSVGSYDWNDQFHHRGSVTILQDNDLNAPLVIGGLSTYSSRGPLRFGTAVKPDLVAPGQYHIAAMPLNVVRTRDTTGHYRAFNGTSAATPYAAGLVALVMEAAPQLTWGEIRELLAKNVTADARTGPCPNGKWGHGKLDYAAAERIVAAARKYKPAQPRPAPTAPPPAR